MVVFTQPVQYLLFGGIFRGTLCLCVRRNHARWWCGWHTIELCTITRGKNRNLGNTGLCTRLLQSVLHSLGRKRNFFTHGNGRCVVIDAEHQKGHEEEDLK